MGNQKPEVEEGQAMQWPKEKQWSTQHYTEN